MMRRFVVAALCLAFPLLASEPRLSSDFEIAKLERQLALTRSPARLWSIHLNLGDLYHTRRQQSESDSHYEAALALAQRESLDARRDSDLGRYADAIAWVGLIRAKMGEREKSFAAFEEAIRYRSGSAKTWNVYASGMLVLGASDKSASAARNAVAISSRAVDSMAGALDHQTYQYTLASALETSHPSEAIKLLRSITQALSSPRFSPLRDQIRSSESFEVFSTTSSDADAWLSLRNRARLRLGRLHENEGELALARTVYEEVLADRSDDPDALGALARISISSSERARYFDEAFLANPFSPVLIEAYESYVQSGGAAPAESTSTGGRIQQAVWWLATGSESRALAALESLPREVSSNQTVQALRSRIEVRSGHPDEARVRLATIRDAQLRQQVERDIASSRSIEFPSALESGSDQPISLTGVELQQIVRLSKLGLLTPDQRTILDKTIIRGPVVLSDAMFAGGSTTTQRGTIDNVAFTFATPLAFRGDFASGGPFELHFRFIGVTTAAEKESALIEPLRITHR